MIKSLLKVIGIGVMTVTVGCKPSPKNEMETEKPNILFILSDDHTAQAWGIYGGVLAPYVQNTHIKRLANQGAVLENSFCTNSICSPSRASILTGQYSHKNSVFTLNEPLPKGHPNLAKKMQKEGYQTALIGKWHLNAMPEGFDYFKVLPGQGRYWDPVFKTKETWTDGHDGSKGEVIEGFSTDVIADLTIEHLKNRNTHKPFLMFTHFKATHEPFDYPNAFTSLYTNISIPEPENLLDFGKEQTGRNFKGQKLENLADRWEKATKNPDNHWTSYPGLPYSLDGMDTITKRKMIYQKLVKDFMRSGAAIDHNIGKLLDFLEQSGLAENTIVIYAADQGYFLGEHGFFDKRLIYEESLKMPFVIRYPKEIKGGGTLDAMVLNTDFASLFADYAGVNLPDTFKGKSFRKQLSNTKTTSRDAVYYRYWMHHPDRPAHLGIRTEQYKLILFYGNGLDKNGADKTNSPVSWELYDLKNDPQERRNLYDDPSYNTLLKELKQELYELKIQENDLDNEYPWINELLTS